MASSGNAFGVSPTMRKRKSISSLSQTSDNNGNSEQQISEREMARKIMYNQHKKKREDIKYQIIASQACEDLAKRMEEVCII